MSISTSAVRWYIICIKTDVGSWLVCRWCLTFLCFSLFVIYKVDTYGFFLDIYGWKKGKCDIISQKGFSSNQKMYQKKCVINSLRNIPHSNTYYQSFAFKTENPCVSVFFRQNIIFIFTIFYTFWTHCIILRRLIFLTVKYHFQI